MTLQAFLKLVEIRTKVASMLPFLAGIFFALYRFNAFNALNSVLFFICLICLDMFTTALNNYSDHKKALIKEGYGYETHNAIKAYDLSLRTVERILFILVSLAVVFGLILFLRTSISILFIGMLAFLIAGAYSYGPAPINHTPYGEMMSGILMGGFIFFVSVTIQSDINVLILWNSLESTVLIRYKEILVICLASLPFILAISNLMLANNICDVEDDILNKRYTLVSYVGKRRSLILFSSAYIILFMWAILLSIMGIYPRISIPFILITAVPVFRNVRVFVDRPSKAETFERAVYNLILIGICIISSLLLGILL